MIETLTIWIIGYILIGGGLAVMIDEINMWYRLLLIVTWPIPIAIAVVLIVYAIVKSLYQVVYKLIKDNIR